MAKLYHYLSVLSGIVIIGGIFTLSLLSSGNREIAPLTTIRGTPFPWQDGAYYVSEALAHTDVVLQEPVVGKELQLTVTTIPLTTKRLSVGVRHNDFWLSYEPTPVFSRTENQANNQQPITTTVRIPLTDKLQDSDRSIDVIFFADTTPAEVINQDQAVLSNPTSDTTAWKLVSMSASVTAYQPSLTEIKDYIRSIIHMERPQ